MGMEYKLGQMELNMMETGFKAKLMGKANLYMQMETYMKANGKTIKQMVMEFILIAMGQDIKVTGKMIPKMVMEHRHGQMAVNMTGCIKMGRNTGMANINGQTVALTKEAG